MMPARSRGRRNDGYILVAVLSVMLLMTSLMAAGSLVVRSGLHSARLGDDDVNMAGVVEGGLELTAYQLLVLETPPSQVDGRRIKLTQAVVVPRIADEAAKVDLNGAHPKLLQSFFEKEGVDTAGAAELVARIAAFRGDDQTDGDPSASVRSAPPAASSASTASTASSQTTGAGGLSGGNGTAATPAQGGASEAQGAPIKKKKRGFQSVEQFRDFMGDARDVFAALAPHLTVFNPDGKINLQTADETVLAAIPGLSKADVALILDRRGGDPKALDKLQEAFSGDVKTYIKLKSGPAYTVRITAGAVHQARDIEAVVAASNSPDLPFYILDWRE